MTDDGIDRHPGGRDPKQAQRRALALGCAAFGIAAVTLGGGVWLWRTWRHDGEDDVLERVQRRVAEGACDEALTELDAHWPQLSSRPRAQALYGRCLLRQGKPRRALHHYERAQALGHEPDDPGAFQHALGSLLQRRGRSVAARKPLLAAVEEHDVVGAACTLSRAELVIGNVDSAMQWRHRCLQTDSGRRSLPSGRARPFGEGAARILRRIGVQGDHPVGYIDARHFEPPPSDPFGMQLDAGAPEALASKDDYKASLPFSGLDDFDKWWLIEVSGLRPETQAVEAVADGARVWKSQSPVLRFGARVVWRARDDGGAPWLLLSEAPSRPDRDGGLADVRARRWLFIGRYLGIDPAIRAHVLRALRVYRQRDEPAADPRGAVWCRVGEGEGTCRP